MRGCRSYNRRVPFHRPLARLGVLPVARFMREVWQRKPLLVRGAFPGFVPPVDRDALFRYAARDDVESRLVGNCYARWSLRHGPFDRLPALRRPRWTLLVQGVDLIDDGARALLSRFRFVPDARLDDLMLSYATDGGGVGPHVDSYDVFLLQAAGRRRWRIGRQTDHALVPDAPLRLLADFRPEQEWVLEAGDMLYLPPGIAHDGVALGESLTYSVGFRAPTFRELLEPWLVDWADNAAVPGRYGDPGRAPALRPARLPVDLVGTVHAALSRARPGPRDTERFLLRHLSEPKARVVFDPPARPRSPLQFSQAAGRHGIALDRRTRMLYTPRAVGINGEWLPLAAAWRRPLAALADARTLSAAAVQLVPDGARLLTYDWYRAGWLHVGAQREA